MLTSQQRDLVPHFIQISFCILLKKTTHLLHVKDYSKKHTFFFFLDYISFNSKIWVTVCSVDQWFLPRQLHKRSLLQMRGKDEWARVIGRGLRECRWVVLKSSAFSIKHGGMSYFTGPLPRPPPPPLCPSPGMGDWGDCPWKAQAPAAARCGKPNRCGGKTSSAQPAALGSGRTA